MPRVLPFTTVDGEPMKAPSAEAALLLSTLVNDLQVIALLDWIALRAIARLVNRIASERREELRTQAVEERVNS